MRKRNNLHICKARCPQINQAIVKTLLDVYVRLVHLFIVCFALSIPDLLEDNDVKVFSGCDVPHMSHYSSYTHEFMIHADCIVHIQTIENLFMQCCTN